MHGAGRRGAAGELRRGNGGLRPAAELTSARNQSAIYRPHSRRKQGSTGHCGRATVSRQCATMAGSAPLPPCSSHRGAAAAFLRQSSTRHGSRPGRGCVGTGNCRSCPAAARTPMVGSQRRKNPTCSSDIFSGTVNCFLCLLRKRQAFSRFSFRYTFDPHLRFLEESFTKKCHKIFEIIYFSRTSIPK